MKTIPALAAVAVFAASCFNPFATPRDPTMTVFVNAGRYEVRWPPGDTAMVRVTGGLDDLRGFAGLEITISGEDMPTRTYDAPYLASNGSPHFKVPDSGYMTLTARIVQDGHIVAQISERWGLGPELHWDLILDRAPYPPRNGIPEDIDNPRCQWWWCAAIWRSPIDPDMANYPDEALWMTLYRVHPDECQDDCPWP